MNELLNSIIEDDAAILENIAENEIKELAELICHYDRVFVAAAGRSLLMMKAFAMRLMHLGLTVHVVGDVTTPAITDRDLLIIGSGSGETETLKVIAGRALKQNACLVLITTNLGSSIARLSRKNVIIPASINHLSHNGSSWQPAGNSFEQCLLLFGDAVVLKTAELKGIDINGPLPLHANLE